MENIPWDNYNYTRVVKTENDPRFKKAESLYVLNHVATTGNTATRHNPNWIEGNELFESNAFKKVQNKAISKVEDELILMTNLFETIYERQQAYDMLISAGKGILDFTRNWRKPKYWKKIGKGIKPKSLPEAWLLYNFGIKPLVGSVNDALNLLGGDFPVTMVRGSSGAPVSDFYRSSGHYEDWSMDLKGKGYAQFRAYILPNINPNAALLNVVGLTTPFSTAWAVLPWGWAVDYFVNVSDLLGNFENRFPGVTVSEVWRTLHVEAASTTTYHNKLANIIGSNSGDVVKTMRSKSSLDKKLTFSFPKIGTNQAANLFAAIALSMKAPK